MPLGWDQIIPSLAQKLGYDSLQDWQAHLTQEVLDGKDIVLTAGTGRGKSTLLLAPLLAKREVDSEVIGLSIAPTKALGEDQVCSLSFLCMLDSDVSMAQAQSSTLKGLPAIAINEDSLREAASATPPRHLFKEVLKWEWALVIVSPEMLISPGFNQVLTDGLFQQHLSLIFVDECHLVDEQGSDFQPCYKSIGLLRSRIPTHVPWIAVSATLPPGRCFDAVMESLGFHANHYTHHTLPIDNHQICYVPRILQHSVSSTSFLDLTWLIPSSATSANDITKTLIFCDTIQLGSRIHDFLQQLLPQSLHNNKRIILPYHSLLSKPGRTTVMESFRSGATRIVIGTDCFTWGVDVPDIRNVVVFGLPSSFSKLVQQIGRAGRDGGQAYAITYAAQWVKDIPRRLQKGTKQEATDLK